MSRFQALTGKQVLTALRHLGFESVRVKGRHHFLRHSDGRKTVVSVQAGESIGPGLLSSILRQVQLSSRAGSSIAPPKQPIRLATAAVRFHLQIKR